MIFDLQQYKDNTAFICEDGVEMSYKNVFDIAIAIENKIGNKNLILLHASNSIDALVYYLSFLYTDNYVILVPQESNIDTLERYAMAYKPDFVCCSVNIADALHIQIFHAEKNFKYGIFEYNLKCSKRINENLALLLPTSGSTGSCKFVRISKENILANASSIINYLNVSEKDRPIMSLPMSYTYGLSVIHSHILQGATILLPTSPIYKKDFWDFFQDNSGTSFSGVPYTYEIIDKLGILNRKFSSLNCLTQAGGKLSERLQRKFAKYAREHKIRFFVMYGQTEATARMTYLPYEVFWKEEKINSVGIPIPETRIQLLDKYGKEITEPYEQGEIIFMGKNVSFGYAEKYQDLKMGNENNFKLNTGDIAYFDEDGFYYICGRKSRFIKLLGKRINLDDIEFKVLQILPCVHCAVTGNDEKLVVWIDDLKEIEEIKKYLVNMLQCNSCLIEVNYLAELPRNSSGKIIYSQLK